MAASWGEIEKGKSCPVDSNSTSVSFFFTPVSFRL
jgi:hypothetical protein